MIFQKNLFALLILLLSFQLKAQITIDNTTYTPTQLIDGVLVPPLSGVTISNVAYRGVYGNNSKYQVGYFSTATTTLSQMGFANGIVLTTGKTSDIPAPLGTSSTLSPSMDEFYVNCTPGLVQQIAPCATFVNDLAVLAGAQNYYNATILEFDFVTVHTSVTFRYVFGSEEYNNGVDSNYQCTEFNDKFGFLISGPGISGGQGFTNNARNMAILPNGSQVSINAVNDGIIGDGGDSSACLLSNPDWIENVVSSEFSGTIDGTNLNGNTQILTASQTNLVPGQTYHIKLIITDASDGSMDSVVYLEGGSFTPQQCNAGVNQSICDVTTTNLTAISPATGTWSVVSGTGNFTSNTSPNTQVIGLSAGANVFRWTSSDLTCFRDVTVTVNTSPVAPIVNVSAPTCASNGSAIVTNYVAGQTYTFDPVGPSVDATGLISGMIFGTSYILTTGNGSCSSANTTPFSVSSILPTPAPPIVSVTAPTCSANGFSTITNYDATLNYTFNPLGPTIDSSGLIQGMVLGTSYEVTSTNASLCTSAVSNSFVNNPMLSIPAVPVVFVTASTCLANGFTRITNYVAGQTYTFDPVGPSVDATGLISGMIFGTPYILTTGNGSCSSANTTPFSVSSILPTPAPPIVSVTAPTCSASGFSTITNYDATLNYTFNPLGPTIDSSGLIQGMVLGTSYEVTSTNASLCTSAVSNSFVNNPMLLVPAVPLVSVTAPTCLANGFARITNYVAGQSYIFDPVGPSVDATGLISGMTFGTSYFVSAGNGSCVSANSTSFVIAQQLPLPTIVSVTNNSLICIGSTATYTITASPNTQVSYTIDGNPTQTVAIDASGVGIVNTVGVMGSTTLTTVSVFDGICTSNVVLSSTVNLFADTTITLVSAASTANQSRCADTTIDPIQYQVTGTATGVSVLGLPAGITHSYDATTGLLTISGATNVAGVLTYSIVTTGGCNPQATASGTITITGRPVLTYTVTDSICDGSPLDFVLSSNLPNTTFIWSATLSNVLGTFVTNGDESNINQIVTLNNSETIGTVTVKITPYANGCSGDESEAITITINPNPVVELVAVTDTSVCSATNATNNVHVEISGNISGITYNWTAITNGVTVVGGTTSGTITAISTTTGFDLQVITSDPLVAGTIYFEVSAVKNGCVGNTLQSEIVTVNPNPGIAVPSPDKTICSGEPTNLMIDVSPLIAGTEIEWEVLTVVNVSGANIGSGIAPQPINDILTSSQGGYVIYRVRTSLGECEGSYTDYRVNVNPSPLPILADGNICITADGEVYQTYTLNTGLNDIDYDFEWFDSNGDTILGETSAILVVDEAGTYSVIATNWLTGCSSSTVTATVTDTMPATSMTVVQSEYFSDNATITVTVPDGTGTLMYSLDEGPLQSSNVFTGVSTGEHLVTVLDTEGCTFMTQIVTIIDYPNYFTPNGDGINDTWNIIGLNQPGAKLYIFDRYGKLVKQLSATDDSEGWDGTYNQELLPSTDYWFSLDYTENGVAKQFKAHFSLKR